MHDRALFVSCADVRPVAGTHWQENLLDEARDALADLAEAFTFARQLRSDRWQFALSLGRLVQLGASESVL